MSPEVVGLSSNPVMTTSCVRHCAKGEWWGFKRMWEEARGREVWVSKRIGGVFSTSPMPYHATASANLPLLYPTSAPGFTLHQAAELAAPSEKPKGAAASPNPAQGKHEPTHHCLPLAALPQWCWIPTEPWASLGCHLLPHPWCPGGAWTSPAGG